MDQEKIKEIKNNILKEMERLEKEKELEKASKKKQYNANRDLELAKNWQKRYIETKKKDGKTQVSVFLYSEVINSLDAFIVEESKKGNKFNRSDIINIAINFYLNNKDNKNDE